MGGQVGQKMAKKSDILYGWPLSSFQNIVGSVYVFNLLKRNLFIKLKKKNLQKITMEDIRHSNGGNIQG